MDILETKIQATPIEEVIAAEVISETIKGFVADVLIIKKIIGGDNEVVTIIPFTSNDLTNGELIKSHGLNRRIVSVTITNPSGLEFSPRIDNLNDNNRVLVDLTRFNIAGTWFLTIR